MSKNNIAKEFILAVERHKVVCEKLLAMPELQNLQPDEHLLSNNSDEWRLLADVFYLSGYIIECTCCAAIYSFYTDETKLAEKDKLRTTTIADDGNTYKVAFKGDPNAIMFASNKDHFLIESKGFQHFNSVFGNLAPSAIPLLGSMTEFHSKSVHDLLNSWSANVRYKVEKKVNPNSLTSNILPLTYRRIFDFYSIANEIYSKVLTTFTI